MQFEHRSRRAQRVALLVLCGTSRVDCSRWRHRQPLRSGQRSPESLAIALVQPGRVWTLRQREWFSLRLEGVKKRGFNRCLISGTIRKQCQASITHQLRRAKEGNSSRLYTLATCWLFYMVNHNGPCSSLSRCGGHAVRFQSWSAGIGGKITLFPHTRSCMKEDSHRGRSTWNWSSTLLFELIIRYHYSLVLAPQNP